MKHTTTRSNKIVAVCAAGLLGCTLFAAPAIATNQNLYDKNSELNKSISALEKEVNKHSGGSNTSSGGNSSTPSEKPSGDGQSKPQKDTNKKDGNQNPSPKPKAEAKPKAKSAHKKSQTQKTKETQKAKEKAESKKVAKENADSANQLVEAVGSKTPPAESTIVASGPITSKRTATPSSGSEKIGFSAAAPAGTVTLEWGSNTPGYWWTSPYFPIGMGVGVAVLIAGAAISAVMRTRYAHQEELAQMDGGLNYTGAYVAPLVPEVQDQDMYATTQYAPTPAATDAPQAPVIPPMAPQGQGTAPADDQYFKPREVESTSAYLKDYEPVIDDPISPDDTSVYLNYLKEEDPQAYNDAMNPDNN